MTKTTKLLNKNFVLLWQGQFVSMLGNQAYAIAMMFWIKHETGSAALVGMIMMASAIPGVLLGPLGGTYSDRHSRKKIIVWCDILSGLAVLTLAFLLFTTPDETDFLIVVLFIVSIIIAILRSFFNPAIAASIPDLVPKEKVATANSMNQFAVQVSTFFGQGSGGVLYRILGAPFLILIDGVTYIISGISEMFITIPQEIPEKAKGMRDAFTQFKKDTTEGFRYTWNNRGLRAMFLIAGMLNFFLMPFAVLMPFFVEDFLHATTDWYGYLMASFGVGALMGYTVAGTFKISGKTRSRFMIVALVLNCFMLFVLAFMTTAIASLFIWVPIGILNGFLNINIMTILQISTPSEIRGRVFGLLGTLSSGLSPIAMGLSGVVAEMLDQNVPLVFMFCGGITTFISILVSFSKDFREFLSYEQPSSE